MKLAVLIAVLAFTAVHARCPNACSSHGYCGPNSQCKCYRNWMGSDCSERVCYYAHAFIDTPLGDLNADGKINMQIAYEEQGQNYALEGYSLDYGVARTIDQASESGRWDEAHFYRECSNKGLCNRKTGQCECFPGYEGEGCQRTTCPGSGDGTTCNGHGLCLSAYFDNADYKLWDAEKTMKCECDPGYKGPSCSLRECPQGPDPVQHSDKVTTSLQKISWGELTYTTAGSLDNFANVPNGDVFWTVTVEDDYGDTWTTNSLSIEYYSSCRSGVFASCASGPRFNQVNGATDDLNSDTTYKWYGTKTAADHLNESLHALPNGAVEAPYVWMWYTGTGLSTIKYPSEDQSGMAIYWKTARTRYPDFNSNANLLNKWWDCNVVPARAQTTTASGEITHTEGLCFYISSSNKVTTNYKVTYTYNSNVYSSGDAFSHVAATVVGTSVDVATTNSNTGAVEISSSSTGTTMEGVPLVTVEEVGMYRYWDVNHDGYPAKTYGTASGNVKVSDYTASECSKRGLCDYDTGECQCFSGYTGISCSKQNAISYSS